MNKRKLVGWAGAFSLLAALSAAACNSVLGIGEAQHDSSLDDAGAFGNDCHSYCTLIDTACTGDNAEYLSVDDCMTMCSRFDIGRISDTNTNSLGCRIHYAQLAVADPVTNCQKAGPLAAGCASPCQSFCQLVVDLCDANDLHPYDGGAAECQTSCAGYTYFVTADTDAGALDAGVGDIAVSWGNTLNCRLFHLESAYASPDLSVWEHHCPHTAAQSETCF